MQKDAYASFAMHPMPIATNNRQTQKQKQFSNPTTANTRFFAAQKRLKNREWAPA